MEMGRQVTYILLATWVRCNEALLQRQSSKYTSTSASEVVHAVL